MRKNIRTGVALSYVNWTVDTAGPLILVPLYARFLGHELYGQWLVILSVTSFLSLAGLGVGQAVSNAVVEAAASAEVYKLASLVSTAFWFFVGTGAIAVVVLGLGARWLPKSLTASPATLVCFLAFLAMSAISLPAMTFRMTLRAFQRVDLEQAIAASFSVGQVVVTTLALFAGLKLIAVAIISGATALLPGVASYLFVRRVSVETRPSLALFSSGVLFSILKPGLYFFVLQVAGTLAFGLDNLVIGYLIGARAVTPYAISFKMVSVASQLFSVAPAALMPNITADYVQGRFDLLERRFIFMTKLAILYATIAAALLWLLGPTVLRWWAGPGVFPGRLTLGLQIAFLFLSVSATPAYAIVMATSSHQGFAVVALLEAIANLVLSLWWGRSFGVPGVIAATVTGVLLGTGWYLPSTVIRALGLSPARVVAQVAPAIATAFVVCASMGFFFRSSFTPSTPASASLALIMILGSLVAYVAFGLGREDRSLLAHAVTAITAGNWVE
jgi:O-antigen/teichoic acid export membrane protein